MSPIPTTSRMAPTPLQRGMLFDSVLAGHRGVHVVQIVVRSEVPFDVARMEAAWAETIARHELLRATFEWEKVREPELRVHPASPLRLQRVPFDATKAPEERILEHLRLDRDRSLDLSRLPVMRAALVDLRDETRDGRPEALVWTLHHALLDGRSFELVLREVFARYDATSVAPLPPPFSVHAEAIASLDVTRARAYWAKVLSGATPTPLALQRTGGRPGAPHREIKHRVPREVTDALTRLGQDEGFTLNTFVQSAWALLLARHNRTNDVVFAATRAGRHSAPGVEASIGCFINTLPVRVRMDGHESTRELVRRVREAHVEVRPFEHTPSADAQRWGGFDSRTPLCATHVVFERFLLARKLRELGGAWSGREVSVHEQGSLPVTLAVYEDDGLLFSLEHDPRALGSEAAEAALRQLGHLLASFADGLERSIDEHALLTDEEARVLVARTQRPHVTGPAPETIPAAFTATALRASASEALRDGKRSFTYGELEAQSNRLARRLFDAGVRRGDVVALYMSRCAEWAVSMLAVAKCGAAFVPVDPELPHDVASFMIRDAGVRLALVVDEASDVDVARSLRVVLEPGHDPGAPSREVEPTDLAYVLYTSGSTGRPKGVAIEHGALLAHGHAIVHELGLSARDRCLQFTSVSFDVSLEEVFPTWLAGATVVLRSREMSTSIGAFLDGVTNDGITVLNLPTGFFHELTHRMSFGARLPSTVRLLIAGGERVQPADLATFRATHPHVRWLNGYGPTEATITATVFDPGASQFDPSNSETVPIGKPLGHARAYVLDARGRVVPVGCIGELYIGGASIAQRYLGNDELTTQRFVRDPFNPGGRMYATGDLARVLPSGDLEFVGRNDAQVKIRGFRIELDGIEATLASHPEVRRAVCAVRPGAGGELSLAAYIVPREPRADAAALREDVRRWLRSQLPAHAVPSGLVVLDALPETTRGKVDTHALPAPEDDAPRARAAVRAPVSPLERDLVSVWSEAFARPVGVEDDFFELGGHSLLALRIVDEISSRLGAHVELAELLGARTIAHLARSIEAGTSSRSRGFRCLVPIQKHGARVPIFGVHVLGRGLGFYRPLAKHLGPDQPIYGLTYPFDDSEGQPTRVEDVARVYVEELRTLRPSGPYLLSAVSLGGVVAYEMGHQLARSGADVTLFFFDVLSPEGMDGVGRITRARMHLAQIAMRGPGYVKNRVVARANKLVDRAHELRRTLHKSFVGELPPSDRVMSVVRENIELASSYEAAPAPLRIVQFRATEDVFYTDAYAASGLGWRDRALRGLHVVDVPGEHLTMLAEPHVAELAARVREWADRAHEQPLPA